MTEMQILFDYWMNNHRDTSEVTQSWKQYEDYLDSTLPDRTIRLNGVLQPYLRELEKQAFVAGVTAGIRLAAECVANNEKCPM
jgi:hypothetical protein